VNFFASAPSFDFLLTTDRSVRIDETLVIGQAREVIATRETGHEFVLVLKNAMGQVAGNACV